MLAIVPFQIHNVSMLCRRRRCGGRKSCEHHCYSKASLQMKRNLSKKRWSRASLSEWPMEELSLRETL